VLKKNMNTDNFMRHKMCSKCLFLHKQMTRVFFIPLINGRANNKNWSTFVKVITKAKRVSVFWNTVCVCVYIYSYTATDLLTGLHSPFIPQKNNKPAQTTNKYMYLHPLTDTVDCMAQQPNAAAETENFLLSYIHVYCII